MGRWASVTAVSLLVLLGCSAHEEEREGLGEPRDQFTSRANRLVDPAEWTPAIVNGSALAPAAVLRFDDDVEVSFFVTEDGDFSVAERGSVNGSSHLTDKVRKLRDPVAMFQTLAPHLEPPAAMFTGHPIPDPVEKIAPEIEAMFEQGSSALDDDVSDARESSFAGVVETPRELTADVTEGGSERVPKAACLYTDYFYDTMENTYPYTPVTSPCWVFHRTDGNPFVACKRYDDYEAGAMNDNGQDKTYVAAFIRVRALRSNQIWYINDDLPAGHWRRDWKFDMKATGVTTKFVTQLYGERGAGHLAAHCHG